MSRAEDISAAEWRDRIGAAEVRADRLQGQANWKAFHLDRAGHTRDVEADALAGLAHDVAFILRLSASQAEDAQSRREGA